ncbi:MAG: hypothetical protein U0667_08590 [Chloroflexota bacterium]
MARPDTAPFDGDGAGHYEIRVVGGLSSRLASAFDGMTVVTTGDGTTRISGPVPDQAGLHGLLQRLRDLGLVLVSVSPTNGDAAGTQRSDHTSHHRQEGRT